MDRNELVTKTDIAVEEIKSVVLTMYNALNKGQQKQIVKDKDVQAIFNRYGIEY